MNVIPHPQVLGNCTIIHLYKKYLVTLGRLGNESKLSFLSSRQCYNKGMGLFSRFTFNQQGSTFHSSGIAGDDITANAASTQSFEQRKAIERRRQHVGNYREAGVLHTYRQTAQRTVVDAATDEKDTDEATPAVYDQRHARSRTTPRTSRIEHRATSRVDIVKASGRRDLSAASDTQPSQATTPRYNYGNFREPQPRKYNPYS